MPQITFHKVLVLETGQDLLYEMMLRVAQAFS